MKPGLTYGQTDAYGYNIADPSGSALSPSKDDLTPGAVHVHDLQATIMHLLGIDHPPTAWVPGLTYLFQGRRFHLIDAHGHVAEEILP